MIYSKRMKADDGVLERLAAFGQANEDIRALILEGSRGAGGAVDALSDYDVNVFSDSAGRYLQSAGWLGQFGRVLIYQKEQFEAGDYRIPTRLVVYANAPRIDFSFWPLAALADLAAGRLVYPGYRSGFKVLLDRDGLVARLPAPDGHGFAVERPGRDEFLQAIYDFWFEAYCEARALARDDLWLAKRIDGTYLRDHFFSIMLWRHMALRSWQPDARVHLGGKHLGQWLEAGLQAELGATFGAFERGSMQQALAANVALFNRLARETAGLLGMSYPEGKEGEVLSFFEAFR